MTTTKIGNIPLLNVNKCIDLLSLMYIKAIQNGVAINKLPSVILWSRPGVGKNQSISQVAQNITEETGKKVKVTDVRLILFNPIDLRGIPTANADKTLAVWLKPEIFKMDPSNDIVNILFLDEISAAAPSVQAAAYQITLDHKIGEHRLPDNCIVIAAGNRVTDKSVAYQMPKALANRLLHLELEAEFDAWNKWAIKNNIHPYVLGFLKFKPDYLNTFDDKTNTLAFSTPRTWEMVSNLLNNVSDDVKVVYELIQGLVGTGIGVEFKSYIKVFSKLPSLDKIFKGEEVEVPTETDVLYALTSSMLHYASVHKDELDLIANSIEYAMKLPADFSLILLKDYMYIEKDYKKKLLKNPVFQKWVIQKGKLLDAIG